MALLRGLDDDGGAVAQHFSHARHDLGGIVPDADHRVGAAPLGVGQQDVEGIGAGRSHRVVSIEMCPPRSVSTRAPIVPNSERERTVTPRTTPSACTMW